MPDLRRPAHRRTPLRRVPRAWGWVAAAILAAAGFAPPAWAGLSVSPLIVDIAAGETPRGDVELRNTGDDRLYVRIEPARVDHPGLADEKRVSDPDPSVLGLIATPGQVILEPGQRKFVRLALLSPPGETERVFRVTVKPVSGDAKGQQTGLKLLVGYDMLVIQRPVAPGASVTGRREGGKLILSNVGNTDVELFRGRRCVHGASCTDLPSERLYAGQTSTIDCAPGGEVEYISKIHNRVAEVHF